MTLIKKLPKTNFVILLTLFVILLTLFVGVILFIFTDRSPPANSNFDRIAFVAYSSFPGLSPLFQRESIFVINVGSPGLTHVIQQSEIDWGIAWSPQGNKLVYFDNSSRNLYMISVNGPEQPELLQQGAFAFDPTWSPDERKIAYSDRAGSIYILDLVTKQVDLLLSDAIEGSHPDWSPNGTQIVFTLNAHIDGPPSSIAVINVDGSGLIKLTSDDGSRSPKWSQDGSRIVFERDRGNIYIMNADGTDIKAVIEDGESHMPDWAPGQTGIVYVSTENQECGISFADGPRFCTNEIRVISVDGSNVVVIRDKGNERYMSPVWAPRN